MCLMIGEANRRLRSSGRKLKPPGVAEVVHIL
jgi:hypothetical protein